MRGLRAYALSTVLRMGTRRGFEKDGFRWKALEMIAMQRYNRKEGGASPKNPLNLC